MSKPSTATATATATAESLAKLLVSGQITMRDVRARVKDGSVTDDVADDALDLYEQHLRTAATTAATARKLSLKIGDKGGVSLYGVNSRFPVHAYAEQWLRIADYLPEIMQFIADNATKVSLKTLTVADLRTEAQARIDRFAK